MTGKNYNDDGGTQRTLNAFSKVASGRESLYRKEYNANSEFRKKVQTGAVGSHVYVSIPFKTYVKDYIEDSGNRLIRHAYTSDGTRSYQTSAFLMQDLAYLASKKDYNNKYKTYPTIGNAVSNKYEGAKLSFIFTSGNIPQVGGMAHPHLPQTYYLIARNNFVSLS